MTVGCKNVFDHLLFCNVYFFLSGTIWSDEASSTFSDIVMAASCQIDVIGTVKSQTKLVNLTSEGSSVGAQLIQGIIQITICCQIRMNFYISQVLYQFNMGDKRILAGIILVTRVDITKSFSCILNK